MKGFELIGGHPALDLVNTLDWRFRDKGPEELIESYATSLRSSSMQLEMIGPRRRAAAVARRAGAQSREDRGSGARTAGGCWRTFCMRRGGKNPSPSRLSGQLEACFNEASRQQQLHWEGAKLEWKLPQSPTLEMPFWLLALSVAQLSHRIRCRCCGSAGTPSADGFFSIRARTTRGAGAT